MSTTGIEKFYITSCSNNRLFFDSGFTIAACDRNIFYRRFLRPDVNSAIYSFLVAAINVDAVLRGIRFYGHITIFRWGQHALEFVSLACSIILDLNTFKWIIAIFPVQSTICFGVRGSK